MTISHRVKLEIVLLLVVLVAAVMWVGWVVMGFDGSVKMVELVLLGIAILTVVGLVVGWLYQRGLGRSLLTIRRQLDRANGSEPPGQVLVDRAERMERPVRSLEHSLTVATKQMDELKQTNRTLEIGSRIAAAERRQLEDVLMFVSDAVLVTNRFDELVFANEQAQQLLGFRLAGSIRRNIDEIISDGTLVRRIHDARCLGVKQSQRLVEHTFDVGESPRTFSIRLCCLAGANDSPAGVMAMLHDITHDKDIERSKTEFVANVSHELKTPLASIKAYIEMLMDGEVKDPQNLQQFYETISSEADRLHRMIDRILDVSRIESGGAKVVREPVSMTAVIRHVVDITSHYANAKEITIEQHTLPVYHQVEADYDLICQAVQNLLTNAIKYTLPKGTVSLKVSTEERRGVAVVEVTDTGIGIPAEELPRIFEKFYRVRANIKMAPGTGLGLPLVKYIVETIHGGKLSVTSEPGKGSTFSFELPLVA